MASHHHPHQDPLPSQELSASLQVFRSHVSNFFNRLALSLNPASETLPFSWVHQCFGLLPILNKAFAKLIGDIDYPMSCWEISSIEGYLNYSLNLMELLNFITSAASHLGQAKLSLSHGLTLVEQSPSSVTEHIKPIQPTSFNRDCLKDLNKLYRKDTSLFGEEWIICQALTEMKNMGLWICGIVLSSLCNNSEPYLRMTELAGGFPSSSSIDQNSSINQHFIERGAELKELKELNDAVACLVALPVNGRSDAAKELRIKLQVFGNQLEDLEKAANNLFSNVMAQRNQLINCLRLRKRLKT